MEKKTKKTPSLEQQKNRHILLSKVCYASKPIITATPLAITMGVKANDWFETDWKVATGGTICIIIMAIASLLVNKKTEDKTITNTWISLCIGWFAVAFIFMLLSQIANEIWWIMLVAGTGILGACGLDIVEKNEAKKANLIQEASSEAKKDFYKQQANEELKKQNEEPVRQATE